MSNLSSWFGIIEKMGEERKQERQKVCDKILALGEPHSKVILDHEDNISCRMWRVRGEVEDGVMMIYFRDEKPDIDSLIIYGDHRIDALIEARKYDAVIMK